MVSPKNQALDIGRLLQISGIKGSYRSFEEIHNFEGVGLIVLEDK